MGEPAAPLIEARDISLTHAPRRWLGRLRSDASPPALRGVSLCVEAGEHLAVIGASGGGKSTLVHILAGLMRPSTGWVRWSGVEVARLGLRALRRRRASHLQIVWQDPYASLDPRATVAATLTESVACHASSLDRTERRKRVEALLADVQLAPVVDARISVLSGGERRRLTVARALAARPAVLIVDEPTTGLDPVLKLEMARLLRQTCYAPGGPTLVLVTHDIDVARYTCRRAAVLDGGALMNLTLVDRLGDDPEPSTARLVASHAETRLPDHPTVFERRESGVAMLEYVVVVGAGTMAIGLMFFMLVHPMRAYLEFALWWLGNPLH